MLCHMDMGPTAGHGDSYWGLQTENKPDLPVSWHCLCFPVAVPQPSVVTLHVSAQS